MSETQAINLVFDGPWSPHGPGLSSGRFVGAETDDGESIEVGTWVRRADGRWTIRISELPNTEEGETRETSEPNSGPSCELCRFCVETKSAVKFYYRECRINPPIASTDDGEAWWPVVPLNGWCGEFERKSERDA